VQQTLPPSILGAQPVSSAAYVQPLVIDADPARPLSLTSKQKLFVAGILLEEENEEWKAALERIFAPYLNRDLSMAEIDEIAIKATRFYRNRGYIVAKAYFPKQDASDGLLEMRVLLGSYGDVSLKNRSRLRDRVVASEFNRMKSGSRGVMAKDLERTVMLVREMPGGAMPSVTLAPGKTPGSTDMQVEVNREGHRYQGYLLGDNQGSRFTGRNRLFGQLEVNSPLGIADRFTVSGLMSDGLRLHNVRVSYELPLHPSGLRLTVAGSRTRYALGGSYSALDATGTVKAVEGNIAFPLLRRHDSNIDLSLNIAHRELHDDLSAVGVFNPRTAEVSAATVQRTKFSTVIGHAFYTSTTATITVGSINMEDATEAKSLGTDGDYSKLVANLAAETPIFHSLMARTTLTMQKNLRTKYLDSSERLFVSGSGGVRAYVEGISGDNGYIFNLELPYPLPKIPHTAGVQQALSIYADSGGVKAEKNGSSLTDFVLNDVGAGYMVTRYPFYAKVQGVRALGSLHSETDRTRLWMQLGFVF
jgi:hemolysin activation/secretion protein